MPLVLVLVHARGAVQVSIGNLREGHWGVWSRFDPPWRSGLPRRPAFAMLWRRRTQCSCPRGTCPSRCSTTRGSHALRTTCPVVMARWYWGCVSYTLSEVRNPHFSTLPGTSGWLQRQAVTRDGVGWGREHGWSRGAAMVVCAKTLRISVRVHPHV